MERLTMADLRSEATLKESGLTSEAIQFYLNTRFRYFDLCEQYDAAVEAKDYGVQLDIEAELPLLGATLQTYAMHPRDAPLAAIKLLSHAPLSDDPIERRYKERIKNPATAMRAFCMNCQGGSTVAVSECSTVNCPLWVFRLGNNPLHGRVLPPANFIDIPDDDVGDIDESADGGDAE